MKLSKNSGGNFTPHEEGNFRGVCVDITPLVKRDGQFGVKEEFRVVFETDAPAREDGSPQCVWSRGFTPSLNEKASFRKFLRQWLGRDLTPAEETEFDTESLLGKCANLVISQETVGDKVYANIAACLPNKGDALAASGKFVRKKDREDKQTGESATYRGAAKPTNAPVEGEPIDNTHAGEDWTKVKVHVGKHSGVELRDLDQEAIDKLVKNWLPVFKSNAKAATADDKRLAAALEMAQKELAEAATQEAAY